MVKTKCCFKKGQEVFRLHLQVLLPRDLRAYRLQSHERGPLSWLWGRWKNHPVVLHKSTSWWATTNSSDTFRIPLRTNLSFFDIFPRHQNKKSHNFRKIKKNHFSVEYFFVNFASRFKSI